ncbi:MAG: cyclic nucleotide-binding domain-containing protein [Anaerolineales bacterium]
MISKRMLKWYPLFSNLSDYMLEEIALISTEIELNEGDWLFCEEAEADKFYIVIEGEVSLTTQIYIDDQVKHLEAAEPLCAGDFLGWSSVVKPHRYTLGGKARKKCKLIEIDAGSFRELLDDNPEYGYHIIKNISEVIGERLIGKCIQFLSVILDSKDFPIEKLYMPKCKK